MNFLAISAAIVASLSAVSAYDSSSSSFGFESSSSAYPSYSSSSSSSSYDIVASCSSSSSYDSSSSYPNVCLPALKDIVGQVNQIAVNYFSPFEVTIRRQSALWFSAATRNQAIAAFAQQFGVNVFVTDALDKTIYPVNAAENPTDFFIYPDQIRAWALNQGSTNRDGSSSYYTFVMFDSFGEMMSVTLSQLNANMPLNQYCFRKAKLNRLG